MESSFNAAKTTQLLETREPTVRELIKLKALERLSNFASRAVEQTKREPQGVQEIKRTVKSFSALPVVREGNNVVNTNEPAGVAYVPCYVVQDGGLLLLNLAAK